MDLSLTYSDISLVPKKLSTIKSRTEIDTDTNFLGFDLKLPILSAPMRTVTGWRMAGALQRKGALGVLHRIEWASEDSDWQNIINALTNTNPNKWLIPSLPVTGPLEYTTQVLYNEYKLRHLCLDIANGYHTLVGEAIQLLKSRFPDLKIIAGNVGSLEGYKYLHEVGADAVRVGIGSGSVCSTSIQTGIGIGQASLVSEISDYRFSINKIMPLVIADGGIKEAGDICKAIALGADVVMLGSMLAGTEEAPGEIIDGKKQFYGEASKGIKGTNGRFVEGVTTLVPFKGPVSNILEEISDGLRSSMSYMNCRTLNDFRWLDKNSFVQLTQNARLERLPVTSQ